MALRWPSSQWAPIVPGSSSGHRGEQSTSRHEDLAPGQAGRIAGNKGIVFFQNVDASSARTPRSSTPGSHARAAGYDAIARSAGRARTSPPTPSTSRTILKTSRPDRPGRPLLLRRGHHQRRRRRPPTSRPWSTSTPHASTCLRDQRPGPGAKSHPQQGLARQLFTTTVPRRATRRDELYLNEDIFVRNFANDLPRWSRPKSCGPSHPVVSCATPTTPRPPPTWIDHPVLVLHELRRPDHHTGLRACDGPPRQPATSRDSQAADRARSRGYSHPGAGCPRCACRGSRESPRRRCGCRSTPAPSRYRSGQDPAEPAAENGV